MSSYKSSIKVIALNGIIVFKTRVCKSVKPLVSTCVSSLLFHTIMTISDLLSVAEIFYQLHRLWKKTLLLPLSVLILSTLCQYIALTATLYEFKWETELHHFLPLCLWDISMLSFLKRELSHFEDKCKSLSAPFCCSCLPPPCVRVCWTTSGLSVLPPAWLPFPPASPRPSLPPFFLGESGGGGGPVGVFVSLAQHCHSGNGSMSSWNHHRSFLSLPASFSYLASLTCSLILYGIFVCHPYSCQPLFSLRESITLVCRLGCQASWGLFFYFFISFLSHRLSTSMTCHLPPNYQASGFPVFSMNPSNSFPLYHSGAYTWACAGSLLPTTGRPTSGNCRCWKRIKQPRVLVLIVNHC